MAYNASNPVLDEGDIALLKTYVSYKMSTISFLIYKCVVLVP